MIGLVGSVVRRKYTQQIVSSALGKKRVLAFRTFSLMLACFLPICLHGQIHIDTPPPLGGIGEQLLLECVVSQCRLHYSPIDRTHSAAAADDSLITRDRLLPLRRKNTATADIIFTEDKNHGITICAAAAHSRWEAISTPSNLPLPSLLSLTVVVVPFYYFAHHTSNLNPFRSGGDRS